MTQDFACFHITRYIQQVSTRLPVVHHLKMASPLKSPKSHILRALDMVLVCLSVPNSFARHGPRHHIMDSYHCFWCFSPHWVFLGFWLPWHDIDSMFPTVLPREASLKVHLKESLVLPTEMQASLAPLRETASSVLPRETSLALPREQMHLVLLHHLQMSTQNNWTCKFILILTQFSLFVITQPLAIYVMTVGNLSRVPFNKRTQALQLRMGLVLVFKKALSRFNLSMTQEHSIDSFWKTVSIIPTHLSIFFPRDNLQRNSLMQMEIRMKKLASNLDIQLMCLPGLLGSSRRRFPLRSLVTQSFFSTKDFTRTSHFACKLILHMWIQLWTWHLR